MTTFGGSLSPWTNETRVIATAGHQPPILTMNHAICKRLFYTVTSVILAAISVGTVAMIYGIARAFHDAVLIAE